MNEEGFKRKLTAILSADVVGYSRMMEENEEATIQTLNAYVKSMTALIQQHRGRVVDMHGDNLLAEFTSAVDAVNCAVEIQRELAERNTELSYGRKMEFRIGVNVGDVVEEKDRIYGDGVNIAARLEAMAEPGGICISGRAYDQVANKLGLEYENLGEHQVKNISTPIRVYRVLSFPGAAAHRVVKAKEDLGRKWRKTIFALAALLVAGVAFTLIWIYYPPAISVDKASVEKMKLPLPDNPSIVVLPFDNLSEDSEQEYLADGITEQIISGLSKMPYMFVIAKNTSFTYKGKPVKIPQVAEELGVQYVLEGSVQKSDERIRITAQLIDALTGRHIWSERYDRILEDIFAVQDDIVMNIMRAMELKVAGLGIMESQKSTSSIDAYFKILKGIELVFRWNKEDNLLARQLYEEAIALDPEYGSAYELLGWTYLHPVTFLWGAPDTYSESLKKAEELGKKAISLGDIFGHVLLMGVYNYKGDHGLMYFQGNLRDYHEQALTEGEKALAIIPNSATLNAFLAQTLSGLGRHEEAIARIKKAMRLNPHPQPLYYFLWGRCYFRAGEAEKALELFQLAPKWMWTWYFLALTYDKLGQEAEAIKAFKEVIRLAPEGNPVKNQAEDYIFLHTENLEE